MYIYILYIYIYIYICTPTYRHTYMHRYIIISRITSRTVIHHRLIDTTSVRTHAWHAFPFRPHALALRWSASCSQIAGAAQPNGSDSLMLLYAGAPIGTSLPLAQLCLNGQYLSLPASSIAVGGKTVVLDAGACTVNVES
jgi:hypothetical protein